MYAVQLAKLGGAEVTGVDNPEKLEFIRSLGADHVIDDTRADVTRDGRGDQLLLDLAAIARSSPTTARWWVGTLAVCRRSAATLLQVLLLGPLLGRAEGNSSGSRRSPGCRAPGAAGWALPSRNGRHGHRPSRSAAGGARGTAVSRRRARQILE